MAEEEELGLPLAVSSTAAAAAACTASLPAATGRTTYLTGFVVSTAAPAAAVAGTVTVTGLAAGTLSFELAESSASGAQLTVMLPEPLAASGQDVAVAVNLPAITGGAASTVTAFGLQR